MVDIYSGTGISIPDLINNFLQFCGVKEQKKQQMML